MYKHKSIEATIQTALFLADRMQYLEDTYQTSQDRVTPQVDPFAELVTTVGFLS
jgi:hypothetical protein